MNFPNPISEYMFIKAVSKAGQRYLSGDGLIGDFWFGYDTWLTIYGNQALLWAGKDELFMARRNTQRSTYQFVSYRLDRKEKAAFTKWADENRADLWQYWINLVESGYKVSHKMNTENGQFYTTLIGTDDSLHNVGFMMTSVHNDPIESILLSLWKHFILFDGSDWSTDDQGEDWG